MRGLTTAARLDQARARSAALGYDIRAIRLLWRQTPQEFGVMMGFGLLSTVTVERWELGLERPPNYVQSWVFRQREYFKLVKRLRRRKWLAEGCIENRGRVARVRRMGPVLCGRDWLDRRRTERRAKRF